MRCCLLKFRCRCALLIWIIGQGPTALEVGAGGGCLEIFLSPFSLSLGDGPKQTYLLFQRAIKPKKKQPTEQRAFLWFKILAPKGRAVNTEVSNDINSSVQDLLCKLN